MGATRVIMALAALGIGAGACMAVALSPSFAPYRDRAKDRRDQQPEIVFDQGESGASHRRLAYADEQADNGFSIQEGPREGTIVLQLPRWAEQTGSWLGFGRRALDELHEWQEPQQRAVEDHHDYAREPSRRDYQPTPWNLDRTEPDRPSRQEDGLDARPKPRPEAQGTSQTSAIDSIVAQTLDAASVAARRANEAAQDARAAEDPQ